MAFKTLTSLDADTTISLGGFNKKTGKANPTSVEGYYIGNRKVDSKKAKSGFCYLHYFQTATGNVAVWGKTDLDRKFLQITSGNMVRASFDKMVPTPNGEMYKFKVEIDAENTIEVNLAEENTTGGSNEEEEYSSPQTGSSFSSVDEDDDSNDDNEDAIQAAALIAAEKKAKVEALLGRNKSAKK